MQLQIDVRSLGTLRVKGRQGYPPVRMWLLVASLNYSQANKPLPSFSKQA